MSDKSLTFRDFSTTNRMRCEAKEGFNHKLGDWSTSDWLVALVGEIDEAANVVKKLNRCRDGNGHLNQTDAINLREMLGDELADALIYLDLIVQSLGLDVETIVRAKFEKTSHKIGYPVELGYDNTPTRSDGELAAIAVLKEVRRIQGIVRPSDQVAALEQLETKAGLALNLLGIK